MTEVGSYFELYYVSYAICLALRRVHSRRIELQFNSVQFSSIQFGGYEPSFGLNRTACINMCRANVERMLFVINTV